MAVPVLPAPAMAQGYSGKVWRDAQGRSRCMRADGTAGVLVGETRGGLVGRSIDSRSERATGAILGAAAGALLGRRIERERMRCR